MSRGQEAIEFVVDSTEAGERLDKLLAKHAEGVSRTIVQRWISAGQVEVDGTVTQQAASLRAGSQIRAFPLARERFALVSDDIPLDVVYEDTHLIVIDKPAGLVVHPAPGHPRGTLVNALVHRQAIVASESTAAPGPSQSCEDETYLRPGIVHRLDKETSGLLVVAKDDATHAGLSAQFKEHSVSREYLAVTKGVHPKAASYRTLHGRHPRDRKKFSGRVARGKHAVTHVKRIAAYAGASVVRCTLETGRTHQIRVHLAEAGFPLLADKLYGSPPRDSALRQAAEALGRHALHARTLGFVHPATGERLHFVREPPEDMRALLSSLAL